VVVVEEEEEEEEVCFVFSFISPFMFSLFSVSNFYFTSQYHQFPPPPPPPPPQKN
jgi:hypothetical protein